MAPDRVPATLSDPPEFVVREFAAPESVAPDASFDVSVTVENTGGSDGTFRASLGRADYSGQPVVRLDVPAGERAIHADGATVTDGGDSVTVVLDWGLGRRGRRVEVEK